VMICFGWGGHLPFVCIQRYNRSRIQRTLDRRHRSEERRASTRRTSGDSADASAARIGERSTPTDPAADPSGIGTAAPGPVTPTAPGQPVMAPAVLPVAPLALGAWESRSSDLPPG